MAYEKEEAVRLVLEAGRRLIAAGLASRTWGNISARISDTQFVITPSGMDYARMTESDIVTVSIADGSYEGSVKPSSEKGIHAGAYALRPDVNFVIHTHQLYATAFGASGAVLRVRDDLLGEHVPCAAYGLPSTKKLCRCVMDALSVQPSPAAVFMKGHGALCLGADMESAFAVSERLEEVCRQRVLGNVSPVQSGAPAVELTNELKSGVKWQALRLVNTPAVAQVSHAGGTVRPSIDDLAQIGGTDYACIAWKSGWEKATQRALRGRNVVFLRHYRAIVAAASEDDAQALAAVLEKDCLAALYAASCGVRSRMCPADALLQRTIYTLKYSKLK